jgi:hypothetical protein
MIRNWHVPDKKTLARACVNIKNFESISLDKKIFLPLSQEMSVCKASVLPNNDNSLILCDTVNHYMPWWLLGSHLLKQGKLLECGNGIKIGKILRGVYYFLYVTI